MLQGAGLFGMSHSIKGLNGGMTREERERRATAVGATTASLTALPTFVGTVLNESAREYAVPLSLIVGAMSGLLGYALTAPPRPRPLTATPPQPTAVVDNPIADWATGAVVREARTMYNNPMTVRARDQLGLPREDAVVEVADELEGEGHRGGVGTIDIINRLRRGVEELQQSGFIGRISQNMINDINRTELELRSQRRPSRIIPLGERAFGEKQTNKVSIIDGLLKRTLQALSERIPHDENDEGRMVLNALRTELYNASERIDPDYTRNWAKFLPLQSLAENGIIVPPDFEESVTLEELKEGDEVVYTPGSALKFVKTSTIPGVGDRFEYLRKARVPEDTKIVKGLVGSEKHRGGRGQASGFIMRMMAENRLKHKGKYGHSTDLPTGSKMDGPRKFDLKRLANAKQTPGGKNKKSYGASPFILEHYKDGAEPTKANRTRTPLVDAPFKLVRTKKPSAKKVAEKSLTKRVFERVINSLFYQKKRGRLEEKDLYQYSTKYFGKEGKQDHTEDYDITPTRKATFKRDLDYWVGQDIVSQERADTIMELLDALPKHFETQTIKYTPWNHKYTEAEIEESRRIRSENYDKMRVAVKGFMKAVKELLRPKDKSAE
jgi:hypothetical protein